MTELTRPSHLGLRHIALFVADLEAALHFYVDLLGMQVEWQPDDDNIYLTSGNDNLAIHRVSPKPVAGRLDHIGFFLASPDMVDQWYDFLLASDVKMQNAPKTHRDGARSFYCLDPEGTVVQMIYHPPIVQS
ncbi:MAG: VOC family protein [Pseudomonadota bacterium]|nr:VOC family protein [Pseudomonadota bacterium]